MAIPRSTAPTPCVVLLADDDPDTLALCAELLARAGHQVETAGDGLAAIEALRPGRFEAAILDVDMPGLTGVEVARELRAQAATRDCVIVFHTATPKHAIDAEFDGYDSFVAKPCFGDALAEALSSAIDAKRADKKRRRPRRSRGPPRQLT